MDHSALADKFVKCDEEAKATVPESQESVTLTLPDGKSIQLPILNGTEGPPVIDIRGLYAQTGYFTHDPGFMSTSSCVSSITFIDGPKGLLRYRGYDISELAEKCDFMDVTYLLLYGDLPDENAKKLHTFLIKRHTMIHEKLIQFYQGFKSDAHPMAICVGVVGALSAFYHDYLDVHSSLNRFSAAYRLIAKMPTIAAMAYKYSIGQPFVYPKTNLSYAENLLNMMFSVPSEPYQLNPVLTHALEVWLILHADHEQNASTSTVRIAGSSYANPFACIASGITTLWGAAHGGANQAVLEMLEEIATVDRIPIYIAKAKNKSDSFRLMGFGHRVYQNYDPRAKIMQEVCHSVLDELKIESDPILDLARQLEKVALEDEYFSKRKLFPNVDFYSGVMLRAMGIPKSMFTVLFAVARTIGWFVNWKEMMADPNCKIGRPRQLYIGKQQREIFPIAQRKTSLVSCDYKDFTDSLSKIHEFKK